MHLSIIEPPDPNCTEAMAIFLILVGLLFESPKVPSKNPPFLLCVFVVPSNVFDLEGEIVLLLYLGSVT